PLFPYTTLFRSSSLILGFGRLPPQVVVMPLILVLLRPGPISRPDRLGVRCVASPLVVSVLGLSFRFVPFVPLLMALASPFLVFRMTLAPAPRPLTRFAVPLLFLRLHSRAFIRNESSCTSDLDVHPAPLHA